jgi:hypothetical protein
MGRALGKIALGAGVIFLAAVAAPSVFLLKAGLLTGTALITSGLSDATRPKFRAQLTAFDPKSINADPAAPRKFVFGRTAFPIDLRYFEPSGTDQEFIDYIFVLAAHKSDAIESIYIEEDLAWTAAGGAQGKYVGYLTVEVITEAGPSAFHTVNAGTVWGSNTRLTGCTTIKVRVKRSDNSKTSQSPFASGVNGRWAIIGTGMPVYDPALDSTVAGGSGSQRANDNTTWAYTATVARGNNPALQLLAYLLGWRIGGVVSVGCGMPADTIDLASFATAAALCDESVALAGGGTQRRFEAGRAFSDGDDPLGVITVLLQSMNGELVDDGGRLALRIAVNDLTAAVTLTDDDFVGGYVWRPEPAISQQYTLVRGRYSQPDAPSLFGLVDYPEVAIPRTSLAPRPLTIELSAVQDQRRAERIAKQAAQRSLFQGEFAVTLGIRGWLLRRNMVVAIDSNVRGWTNKLFRVRSLGFNDDGTINATFRPEDASIYAWDADESAVVTPVGRTVFDMRKAASWLMAAIEPGADVTPDQFPELPQGQWTSGTDYTRGQVVQFNLSTYTALQDHTAATINAPGNAAFWALVAVSGDSAASILATTLTASTSYGTGVSGVVQVRAGTGGVVTISAPAFSARYNASAGSNIAFGKWQRETTPGTWVDVMTEVSSGTILAGSEVFGLNYSVVVTGLSAGALVSFRFVSRVSVSPPPGDDMSLGGFAVLQGS